MEISKPSKLRRRLDRLNWDIFVWHVYVGDAIEAAIDWVLVKVNAVLDLTYRAYDRALDAWYKAVELSRDLRSLVYREVQEILDNLSTWSGQLNEWWAAKRYWVLGVIDAGIDRLRPLIDQARAAVARVETAWDSFRKDTLPGLFTIERWTAFWGGRVDNISDWLAATRQQMSDIIETVVAPVRSEVNKHSGQLDLIKEFFTDPFEWLWARFINWFLGPEE